MPNNGAHLGFEQKLWKAADKLRSNMDAAEYKHVVLGLIFLKYISDSFDERHEQLQEQVSEGADPEDRDEYSMENVFWVPEKARWSYLQKNAKQPEIGKIIDDAMELIEKENPSLKGVLPKDYARPTLDKRRVGELIDLIGTIGLGDYESRSKDILGRVYEYFLGEFASAEGKKGGQFYTPKSIVKVLVEMIEPYKGRVYDPCCGSSGMFVQIDGDIQLGDSFHNDLHKDLKADLVDCMIALPSQLFYNTMIPACLWFISRDKTNNKFRDRSGEILFIDARNMGEMIDRRHRELTDEEIKNNLEMIGYGI